MEFQQNIKVFRQLFPTYHTFAFSCTRGCASTPHKYSTRSTLRGDEATPPEVKNKSISVSHTAPTPFADRRRPPSSANHLSPRHSIDDY